MAERLHTVLARAGVASRRQAEEWIRKGRIKVNGKTILTPGTLVEWGKDAIRVGNRLITRLERKLTIVLNKPKGVITSMHDPEGRATTADLVKRIKERIFPVGRLDYHTEGLLLMTNDGELAQILQHPRYGVPKTYVAKVKGKPAAPALRRLRSGVVINGRRTAPARVRIIGSTDKNTWFEVTVKEGMNRQVRQMCLQVGHPVLKLKRTRYGPILLGNLAPGTYRELTRVEEEKLQKHLHSHADKAGKSKTRNK